MLKKILMGVSLTVVAATMAYAQNAPQGAAPGAAPAAGARGARAGAAAGGAAAPARPAKLPTEDQWTNMPPAARAFQDKAIALAGNDEDLKLDVKIFCQANGGANGNARNTVGVPVGAPYPAWGAPSPSQRLPAQHLFDNFWWLGDTGVGSWLLTDPAGYILFDASNNAAEAQEVIVDAMKKVGLDPKKIKYMVFGHFHGDHTGGGHLIQTISGAKAVMGRDDWKLYLKMFEDPSTNRLDDKTPMTRDIDAEDGMVLKVGNTSATVYQMTGHTPGSIGMIAPVKWQGKDHPILLVTAGSDVSNREAFIGGYEHIWDIGIKRKVESVMQVHPKTNINLLARVKYVNDNYDKLSKGGQNPLLYGAAKTEKYINITRACTEARMAILGW